MGKKKKKDHAEPGQYGKFCAIREEPCPDSPDTDCSGTNKYREDTKPNWGANYKFDQVKTVSKKLLPNGKKRKHAGKKYRKEMPFNAHHIVCVADIAGILFTPDVFPVVRETAWCVNAPINMVALPLWGHTLKHYCDLDPEKRESKADPDPPPFKDLPQHDYDHYRYQRDHVRPKLQKIKDSIDLNNSNHEDSAKALAGALNKLAQKLRKHIENGRETHQAWCDGFKAENKDTWYKPFSMAKDPSFRAFPSDPGKLRTKLGRMVDALSEKLYREL